MSVYEIIGSIKYFDEQKIPWSDCHIGGDNCLYEVTPIQIYWKFHFQNLKIFR